MDAQAARSFRDVAVASVQGAADDFVLDARQRARRRRDHYDLGEHDLGGLLLPIPAAFTITLDDGRILEGEGDVPAGALTLPEGAARAAEKLRSVGGGDWHDWLLGCRPDTNLSASLPKLV